MSAKVWTAVHKIVTTHLGHTNALAGKDIVWILMDRRVIVSLVIPCNGKSLHKQHLQTDIHQNIFTILKPTIYCFISENTCPSVPGLANGHVSSTTLKSFYGCNSGYKLNGPSVRECHPDGQWSGVQPTCTSKCHSSLCFSLISNNQFVEKIHKFLTWKNFT